MKWAFLENLETHLIRRWASQGWQNKDMAVEVALDRRRVALWCRRFLQGGIVSIVFERDALTNRVYNFDQSNMPPNLPHGRTGNSGPLQPS